MQLCKEKWPNSGEDKPLFISRFDPIPFMSDLHLSDLMKPDRKTKVSVEFPFSYDRCRQILVANRPVKAEQLDGQILEKIMQSMQCHACMILLPDSTGKIKLAAIRATPDYPLFCSEFVNISLSLAQQVYTDGEEFSISRPSPESGSLSTGNNTDKNRHEDEHLIAIPIYGRNQPVGVFIFVTNEPIKTK